MKFNLKNELDLAIIAALRAGKYLRELKKVEIESEEGKDIKLKADKESEKIILSYLKKSKHSILSEEDVTKKRKRKKAFWIVDPLDGSMNFKRNLPFCVISIALWRKNKPLLGVIYDFNKEDLYYGGIGKGSWLNNKKINVSKISEKNKAILMTGFPIKLDYSGENLKDYVEQIQKFKKIRHIGSAALSLAYVASGKVEAYYEKDIMLWDIAAGLALVKAAGGTVDLKQTKGYQFEVFASNKKLI